MNLIKNDPPLSGDIIIQISKDSDVKLEYDGFKMHYDRMLDFRMPYNYGTYLKGRIQEDGDLLDVLVLGPSIKSNTILETDKLEPLAILEYYDSNQRDVKVIFGKKEVLEDKKLLYESLYDISNYMNYLYYYKTKPNYVSKVYYSPFFAKNNVFFKNTLKDVIYEEKNLRVLLQELLN